MKSTRVMIVDRDLNYLNWLFQEINTNYLMKVEFIATSREQALMELKNDSVDLILMDINLDESDPKMGIHTICEIKDIKPHVKIVVISELDGEEYVAESIFMGADGYLFKKNLPKSISFIENWLQGEQLPIDMIIEKFRQLRFELLKSKLTNAEKDVFDLLHTGLNQRQISQKLFKSSATIKKQVKQILIKFEVISTKELIKKVRRNIQCF